MRPQDLNYQHLRYFHTVAHEGSVLRASRVLGLAPSTVSGQIKTLEEAMGRPLVQRAGRGIALTPFGHEVLRIADAIFELGDQLAHTIAQGAVRRLVRVGVSSVLPKLLVRELLQRIPTHTHQLDIRHSSTDELVGALAARRIDVVLSDAPLPSWATLQATSHLVIASGIALFASDALCEQVGDDLMAGLGRVPWLAPPSGTSLRNDLEAWWERHGLEPDIASVVDDSALMKALGDAGVGVFAAPERMMAAVLEGYRVQCLGTTQDIQERVFAITREASPDEPALRALCQLVDDDRNVS